MEHGLCHRCEYRAQFFEQGHAPRCQCGDAGSTVISCYQYRPVKPLVLKKTDGDKRPLGAPAIISPRMERAGLADMELCGDLSDGELVIYWGFPSTDETGEKKDNQCATDTQNTK